MKRILSMMIVVVMMSTTAMATTGDTPVAIPTLYDTAVQNFQIEQEGDMFTIVVSENASTGYLWHYTINKDDKVEFVGEETILPNVVMPGAPSEKRLSFRATSEGVSTILFENSRAFGDEDVAETLTILVYKTADKLIIEEDQIVYALDTPVATLYNLNQSATFNGEEIMADVDVQNIDGLTMVPLRATLEAMGYTVTWKPETRGVEISKGAQWTALYIGRNAYFRNKMAPHELSSAPVIVNNRTLVPVEFFADIIGKGITVDEQKINFQDMEAVIHRGYVKSIMMDETGVKTLTLTSDMASDSMELQTIIHSSKTFTFYQGDVVEGDFVKVVSSMIMTASMPGQTSGYVVYK